MEQQERRPGLIRDRFDAAIAVCFTAFITVLSLRVAFSDTPHKPHWLISLDFTRLPIAAVGIVNVAFYIGLVWASVSVYRNAQPKERVLVLGWLNVILTDSASRLIVSASRGGDSVDQGRWYGYGVNRCPDDYAGSSCKRCRSARRQQTGVDYHVGHRHRALLGRCSFVLDLVSSICGLSRQFACANCTAVDP
jgi:hypothetical protein